MVPNEKNTSVLNDEELVFLIDNDDQLRIYSKDIKLPKDFDKFMDQVCAEAREKRAIRKATENSSEYRFASHP